jgi:hypothetical protein
MISSGSCVRPADIDGDGDSDIFVGGRIIPGRYPEAPESYVLLNNGKGNFTIAESSPEQSKVGMVTDAVWVDLNNDKSDDLIVVGEWMGIEVFLNEKGSLRKSTDQFVRTSTEGWWNCIVAEDFDGDGDKDFIVGNVGLNNQIKASEEHPATMWFADFDENGSVDPLLTYYIMDKSYPYPSRDELTEQLPAFKRKFKDYTSYSNADLDLVLNEKERSRAAQLNMVQMQSCFIRNEGDRLVIEPLPIEMQIAPVFAVATLDVNHDGKMDFVAGGNLSGTRSRTGKMTGNTGFVFLGDGNGKFKFVTPAKTGLRSAEDVRKIVVDGDIIIMGINNTQVQMYELNPE